MDQFEDYAPDNKRLDKQQLLSKMVVRMADNMDIDGLTRVHLTRNPDDYDKIATRFKDEISQLNPLTCLLLVAEIDGLLIGFARATYFMPAQHPDSHNCPEGWYLSGIIIDPKYRRLGIASTLTTYRLDWIAERANKAYYFANARNRVSIDLHEKYEFTELTRDFNYPNVEFEGGEGILFVADLIKH
jgi:ribosomal protein S18 acetylase RimI-like enzyme